MVSLTTVYIMSVILTSVAGIGSSFVGNRFIGGAAPQNDVIDYGPEPEWKRRPLDLKISQIGRILNMKLDMPSPAANAIREFIETPVSEWKKVGQTPEELRVKYNIIKNDRDTHTYPVDIKEIYYRVDRKYDNMLKATGNLHYEDIGDETEEAISVLTGQSNIEQT